MMKKIILHDNPFPLTLICTVRQILTILLIELPQGVIFRRNVLPKLLFFVYRISIGIIYHFWQTYLLFFFLLKYCFCIIRPIFGLLYLDFFFANRIYLITIINKIISVLAWVPHHIAIIRTNNQQICSGWATVLH